MASWRPRLIPRKEFNAERLQQSLDQYNLPTNTPTAFIVENASAQPTSGESSEAGLKLYRDKVVYKIFTTTPLIAADEGTNILGDRIELYPNRWFKVIKVNNWDVGVQTHYEAMAVEENER